MTSIFLYDNYYKIQLLLLLTNKTVIIMPPKYFDFIDIVFLKFAIELFKHISINDYAIDLVKDLQLFCKPIFSLGSVELEILKIFIKTNLANIFICPSKSFTSAFILFVHKPSNSLWLYVNDHDLNKPIIKNQDPLLLISELFN